MLSWVLHRVTGILLVFSLLYHFIFMHFIGFDNYSYNAVIERLREPSWKLFNIVFLFSALYHGFYGLHGIIIEYVRNDSLQRILRFLIVTIPIVLGFFGVRIVFLNN